MACGAIQSRADEALRFKTVYLTGAPASGKSSTVAALAKVVQPLEVWEYGSRLTAYIQERDSGLKSQSELRALSAGIVRPEDVNALDERLITFVEQNRSSSHIIIDSHPVTKEIYGFRITAFSHRQLFKLNPDEIWFLFVSPEITVERISKNAEGRPLISPEEARMHTHLQSSVAASYGVALGCPVYLFDSGGSQDELVERLRRRFPM